MAEAFIGEIRIMSFNFAPQGWAHCDGQVLQISQNNALFALLGTTYGGNGQTTFALPDFRGRVPIHAGGAHSMGEQGGEYAHTLTGAEMPSHIHLVRASASTQNGHSDPTDSYLGSANNAYHAPANLTPMLASTVAGAGGSQPHDNTQPYLTLSFCIAMVGIFPSRN
jgi:microcystin-dependent protein